MKRKSPKKRKTTPQPDQTFEEISNTSKAVNQIIPLSSSNYPQLPSWTTDRPFLSSSFLASDSEYVRPKKDEENRKVEVIKLPIKVQELVFTEELLSCLLGFETRHIQCVQDNSLVHRCKFVLNKNIRHNPSLGLLVQRILPVGSNYANLMKFVETHNSRYDCGKVVHAFCASIQHFLKQYMELVTHLESLFYKQHLTLHKLVYHLQPARKTLDVLSRLVRDEERRGGALLRFLHEQSICMSGDSQVSKIFQYLLEKVSKPYFEMLSNWMNEGVIHDPYEEFMIREDKSISCDVLSSSIHGGRYWEDKYLLRIDQCPLFVERFSFMILRTGKYLNIIKETLENKYSNKNEIFEEDDEDEYTIDDLVKSSNNLSKYSYSTQKNIEEEEEILSPHKNMRAGLGGYDFEELKEHDNLVISQISKTVDMNDGLFEYTPHSQILQSQIEKCFQSSSIKLLSLIIHDYQLINQLEAFGRYFFLDRGDWLVIFFDVSERFLVHPISKIEIKHLQALFEHSLKKSTCKNDSFKKQFFVSLKEESLKSLLFEIDRFRKISDLEFSKEKSKISISSISKSSASKLKSSSSSSSSVLRGIESFCLDVFVPFPLSIILNSRIISKYQIIFRHLFYCKYVERAILNSWIKLKFLKYLIFNHSELGKLHLLHQKMLNFIKYFQYYIIQNKTKYFKIFIQKIKLNKFTGNLDDILIHHEEFLEVLLKTGFLTININVFKSLSIILTSCLNFSVFLIQFVRKLNLESSQFFQDIQSMRRLSEIVKKETSKKQFQSQLKSYKINFNKALKGFVSNVRRYFKDFSDTQELKDFLKIIQESYEKKIF